MVKGSGGDAASCCARGSLFGSGASPLGLACLSVTGLPTLHNGGLDVPIANVGVGNRLIVVHGTYVLCRLLWCPR